MACWSSASDKDARSGSTTLATTHTARWTTSHTRRRPARTGFHSGRGNWPVFHRCRNNANLSIKRRMKMFNSRHSILSSFEWSRANGFELCYSSLGGSASPLKTSDDQWWLWLCKSKTTYNYYFRAARRWRGTDLGISSPYLQRTRGTTGHRNKSLCRALATESDSPCQDDLKGERRRRLLSHSNFTVINHRVHLEWLFLGRGTSWRMVKETFDSRSSAVQPLPLPPGDP